MTEDYNTTCYHTTPLIPSICDVGRPFSARRLSRSLACVAFPLVLWGLGEASPSISTLFTHALGSETSRRDLLSFSSIPRPKGCSHRVITAASSSSSWARTSLVPVCPALDFGAGHVSHSFLAFLALLTLLTAPAARDKPPTVTVTLTLTVAPGISVSDMLAGSYRPLRAGAGAATLRQRQHWLTPATSSTARISHRCSAVERILQ